MPSNYLILCRPLLVMPSIFPSIRVFSIELALCIRQPKYWSFSFSIWLFETPWTVSHQAPLFMEFSMQEYWGELPFPTPGDLPNPWVEPESPALAGGFFTTEPPGFSIHPSNEYSRLISFRIDQFDLLAVQGTLESSPAPQFKSISCSALSLLYGPIHWKNHSFDYRNLCRQSDVSAFQYAVQVCHRFSSKEQASFNFMATVTVHSDFGAQENIVCNRFQFYPLQFAMK